MRSKFVLLVALLMAIFLAVVGTSSSYAQNYRGVLKSLNMSGEASQFQFQIIPGDKLVLGDVFILKAGETVGGNMYVFGGSATLNPGSLVDGDLIMIGGTTHANGSIAGGLTSLAGLVTMSETTQIGNDVNVIGSSLIGEEKASIQGKINGNLTQLLPLTIPGEINLPFPKFEVRFNPVWDMLWLMLQSFLWSALAVVLVLFLAGPTERVGQAAVGESFTSAGLGCLTLLVAPLMLLLLGITIIGIPISLIGVVVLTIAVAFGIISLGTQAGQRLEKAAKADWPLPVSAGLGTFLVVFVSTGVGKFIPCLGLILPFIVVITGLGAVLLTRFGAVSYPDSGTD